MLESVGPRVCRVAWWCGEFGVPQPLAPKAFRHGLRCRLLEAEGAGDVDGQRLPQSAGGIVLFAAQLAARGNGGGGCDESGRDGTGCAVDSEQGLQRMAVGAGRD